jgi:hypothetical protein
VRADGNASSEPLADLPIHRVRISRAIETLHRLSDEPAQELRTRERLLAFVLACQR